MIYLGDSPVGVSVYVDRTNITRKNTNLSYRWAYGVFDDNEELVIDCDGIRYKDYNGTNIPPRIDGAFLDARNVKTITLKNFYTNPTTSGSVAVSAFEHDSYFGTYSDNLETVSFEGKTVYLLGCRNAFAGRSKLKTVNAVLDFSRVPAYSDGYNFANFFKDCSSLVDVRVNSNSILWMNSYQLFNCSQNLSDESLVSIANGLSSSATAHVLTLLSTPKARCSTLMGTNNSGTFVADENGTLSLSDFITTVKGWTLT